MQRPEEPERMRTPEDGMQLRPGSGPLPSRTGETAATAVAASAQAVIQARYVVAMQRPRNWDMVRSRLLAECRRPNFAADAEYSLPRNVWNPQKRMFERTFIVGASIRMAEAVMRSLPNIMSETQCTFDDDHRRIIKVTVTDLETNLTLASDVAVPKTVERRSLKKDQKPLWTRQNSYGDTLYVLPATDDEVRQAEGSLVSRALRNLALKMIPGDILDEAIELSRRTVIEKDKADPEAGRRSMLDSFETLGISPADLAEFLGHDLKELAPEEVKQLRGIYRAVRDGHASWEDLIEEQRAAREEVSATTRQNAETAKANGVNGRKATIDRIATQRLMDPKRYAEVCAEFNVPPKSADWQQDFPEDVLGDFLAALLKNGGGKA